jgi:hypothetical protein
VHGETKVPFEVFRISDCIRARCRYAWEVEVLERLLHHKLMARVWRQLLAKKRGMPGVYMHPAIGDAVSADGPAIAQNRACGELFSAAFFTICNPVPASKWDEVEEFSQKMLADAATYLRVAGDLADNGLVDPAADGGVAPLLRLAKVKKEQARRALAQMRTRDDPLVIDRDRGDRTVRGVSTLIAARMRELFGEDLLGLVSILVEVGLGKNASRQAVRSACKKIPRSTISTT